MARPKLKMRLLWLVLLPPLLAACHHTSRQASAAQGVRIVSTVPAATEILLQIGAGSTLVGVSRFDKPLLPPAYKGLPVVGDYLHLNDEQLLELHPSVLIMQISPLRMNDGLSSLARRNHIALVNVHLSTLGEIKQTALALGKIAHRVVAAKAAVAALNKRLAGFANDIPPPGKRPRVLYLVGTRPMRAVGAGNFLNRVMALAGGINVGAKLGHGFPVLTHETLLDLKPSIILLAKPGEPPQCVGVDSRIAAFAEGAQLPPLSGHIFLITNPLCEMPTLDIGDEVAELQRIFTHLQGNTPWGRP